MSGESWAPYPINHLVSQDLLLLLPDNDGDGEKEKIGLPFLPSSLSASQPHSLVPSLGPAPTGLGRGNRAHGKK